MIFTSCPGKLRQDMIGPLFISLKIRLKIVRKKKQFQDSKDNHEFKQDNLPQGSAHRHGLKSVMIQGEQLG